MDKDTAKEFWTKVIGLVSAGNESTLLGDPESELSVQVKAGFLDGISVDEFDEIRDSVLEYASFWEGHRFVSAGQLMLNAIKLTRFQADGKERLISLLAELSAASGYEPWEPGSVREARRTAAEKLSLELASDPRKIYGAVGERVLGQDAARRAASMLVYGHLRGRRSNALFYGPTGCGKTEIWRALSESFPGLISIIDSTQLAPDGWRGSMHLRDIFERVPKDRLASRGLIVVLDEADKVFCETIVSGSGTDHSALLQSGLLKMLDGDRISFGADSPEHGPFTVDCSKVSVVLLGTFEKLLEKKGEEPRAIGFGAASSSGSADADGSISYEDLIAAGMRREIAGRVSRIARLEELSVSDYRSILDEQIMAKLAKPDGPLVEIDGESADMLAEEAADSGLGVRLMRSRVMNALDDLIFEDPGADRYVIDLRGAA